jgi:hypothetical protein
VAQHLVALLTTQPVALNAKQPGDLVALRFDDHFCGRRAVEGRHGEHEVVFRHEPRPRGGDGRPESRNQLAATRFGFGYQGRVLLPVQPPIDEFRPGGRERPRQRDRDDAVVEHLEARAKAGDLRHPERCAVNR